MRVLPLSRYSSTDGLKIRTDNEHVLEIRKVGHWECALDRHALFPITAWPYKVKKLHFCTTFSHDALLHLRLEAPELAGHRQRPPRP